MLKVTDIVLVADDKQPKDGRTLCSLVLTADDNVLLASTFVADVFTMGAHLDRMTAAVMVDGKKDVQAMLMNAKSEYIGKPAGIIPNAYGFCLNVQDILEEDGVIGVRVVGTDIDMTTRRAVGVGTSESAAKADAIAKERARLMLHLNKGKLERIMG